MKNQPQKEKKPYEAPAFRAVRLEIKSSILASCRLSGTMTQTQQNCKLGSTCFGN